MSPIERAQLRFARLTPDRRDALMARLCVSLAGHARNALAAAEPDVAAARAFVDLLLEAQKVLPPLPTIGAYGFGDAVVESVGALFLMADALGVRPQVEAAWDDAWAYVRSGALGPGANSNGDVLAGMTDRARAQIAKCLAEWPVPSDATPIPLICIDHGPNFAGMYHDRVEVEDDIAAVDGFKVVLTLENFEAPPRGKTLDFDGRRFVLV